MFLTHDQRVQIITLRAEGLGYQQLADRYHVRKATIIALLQKHEDTGSIDDRARSGRPKISTVRQDRALLRLSSANPRITSRGLSQQWQETSGVRAHPRTVRRRLFSAGRYSYVAPKKPLLTARHKARRLEWAREHIGWTVEDWKRVLFTDETPIPLVQTTQRRYYRSVRGGGRVQNIVQPRLQGGGGTIMVWGAFSYHRALPLHRVQGNLNAQSYVHILEECVLPVWNNQETIFQQDNARPHTARLTREWFERHNIQLLQWPANSPDLNPIENFWSKLKSDLDSQIIHGMQQLFEYANRTFTAMDPEFMHGLVESMPRRCQAVISSRGGHIDY